MHTRSPADFLRELNVSTEPEDHHFTGPPSVWQAENEGSVFHIEGRILYSLAFKYPGLILEIGSDLGVSTRYIHQGLDDALEQSHTLEPAHIYCVDPIHKWPEDASWPRRHRIVGYSPSDIPLLEYDWAFIDGDHRYDGVMADIAAAKNLVHGPLVFHDTAPRFSSHTPTNTSDGSEARRAILDSLPESEWQLTEITSPCGLIYAIRK